MIDHTVIQVQGGNGGNGAISGRHEKYVPRGGPDGGDGGDGGSVYLVGDVNVNTLRDLRYRRRFVAQDAGHGRGSLKHGRNGVDVEVVVPVGTEAWTDVGSPACVVDLRESGERVLVARGGRGGRGNARFTSPTNRFPLLAEEGEEGEAVVLRLELKLLADVGIIGAPNAGKSSLLAALSRARPKVADYPFTTLEPVLGVVEWGDESFVMVDIPGLVEGAHEGTGLGHEFLRHVERTRVLVHMVDASAENPASDYRQINEELSLFNADLARRPQIVALNKIDLPGVSDRLAVLEAEGWDHETYAISAATHEGLHPLLDAVQRELSLQRALVPVREGTAVPVVRPAPRREPVGVGVKDGVFVVEAPGAARVAAMVDASDWNARMQFYAYLRRVGVVKALEGAGVAAGDVVRIGRFEWEWD